MLKKLSVIKILQRTLPGFAKNAKKLGKVFIKYKPRSARIIKQPKRVKRKPRKVPEQQKDKKKL